MNSGSSAPISSGGQSAETLAASSCSQTSRPAVIATAPPVRLTTITRLTDGLDCSASSALALSGILRLPRKPSSAVIITFESQSWRRLARLSGEKPPNTTEWIAPMRAHASMA